MSDATPDKSIQNDATPPDFPAFPHWQTWIDGGGGGRQPYGGMTMRDYFAAKALQALIPFYNDSSNMSALDIAKFAYEYADEMMRAREK